eukprot:COSAG05_NODE_8489_length_699_cov_0.868333_2_plen_45_part_00
MGVVGLWVFRGSRVVGFQGVPVWVATFEKVSKTEVHFVSVRFIQ